MKNLNTIRAWAVMALVLLVGVGGISASVNLDGLDRVDGDNLSAANWTTLVNAVREVVAKVGEEPVATQINNAGDIIKTWVENNFYNNSEADARFMSITNPVDPTPESVITCYRTNPREATTHGDWHEGVPGSGCSEAGPTYDICISGSGISGCGQSYTGGDGKYNKFVCGTSGQSGPNGKKSTNCTATLHCPDNYYAVAGGANYTDRSVMSESRPQGRDWVISINGSKPFGSLSLTCVRF